MKTYSFNTSFLHNYIDTDPDIRGGHPCIQGTGFTVAQALAEIADMQDVAEFCNQFDIDNNAVYQMLLGLSRMFLDEPKAKRGRKKGYRHSLESRAKMSASNKGRPAHNKGIPLSDETKAKISAARKGTPLSDAHKAKISERARKRWLTQRGFTAP